MGYGTLIRGTSDQPIIAAFFYISFFVSINLYLYIYLCLYSPLRIYLSVVRTVCNFANNMSKDSSLIERNGYHWPQWSLSDIFLESFVNFPCYLMGILLLFLSIFHVVCYSKRVNFNHKLLKQDTGTADHLLPSGCIWIWCNFTLYSLFHFPHLFNIRTGGQMEGQRDQIQIRFIQ